jgi:hypothetical protein
LGFHDAIVLRCFLPSLDQFFEIFFEIWSGNFSVFQKVLDFRKTKVGISPGASRWCGALKGAVLLAIVLSPIS